MEKYRKRIWKRRSSHSIRIDVPESGDPESPEPDAADESNVPCPHCGSLLTRASSTLEFNFAVVAKGRLYRCRKCKAHFRARPPKTDFTRVGSIAAATTAALVLIILGVANWGRITGFFIGLQPGNSRLEQVQQPLKKTRNGGFTSEDAEELAYEVVDLYQTADLYHRQFPAMERAYRDVIGDYKDLLEKERNGQRAAANPLIADRLQRVSSGFGETLERGHDTLVKYMETLRQQTDAANRVGAKRLQSCSQTQDTPAAATAKRNCDELALVLATLKTNTEQAEMDFTGSEQEFNRTCQEINRIAVAYIGHPIMNQDRK